MNSVMTKTSLFVSAILLTLSSSVLGDAYKCKVGNKSVFQAEPCSSTQETLKATRDYVSPESTQASQQQWENIREEMSQRDRAKYQALQLEQKVNANIQRRAIQNQQPKNYDLPIENNEYPVPTRKNLAPDQYFMTRGGTMQQAQGSDFAYDNNGNAYHKPQGSAFSYGPGGKTCFHFGAFADCK